MGNMTGRAGNTTQAQAAKQLGGRGAAKRIAQAVARGAGKGTTRRQRRRNALRSARNAG